MNRYLCFASILVVCSTGLHAAEDVPSGPRVALLVGNANYDSFTLAGVDPSLGAVEKSLVANGFQVTRHQDLAQKAMKDAFEQFRTSIPTNGVAVVYYVGLAAYAERFGKQYNLLRPIKEKIGSSDEYRSRGLNVNEWLESWEESSGGRQHLIFLDGCWESPLLPEKGEVSSGLFEMTVESGMAVMFAAESGKRTSTPATESASPFAKAVAKRMGTFDASVLKGCQGIASDIGDAWIGGASERGIGTRFDRPTADSLREGKQAGEGYVNSVGISFRWCPAGSFTMGSPQTDTAVTRDRAPVDVTISQGFWMGEYEVTQREYRTVMRKNIPTQFTVHKNAPYWGASEFKSVTEFCSKLNDIERKAGRLPSGWEYVCPTEAEWEYACRAGSEFAAFCFGDDPTELGLYGNFRGSIVGNIEPKLLLG